MERMRVRLFTLTAMGILMTLPAQADSDSWVGRNARVCVPVADLRHEPSKAAANRDYDPSEESQLLYGDAVGPQEEKGEWVRVSASQQLEWSHTDRWEGYPGWMERSSLVLEPADWNPNLLITAKWATVRSQPDRNASILLKLSVGTRLEAQPEPLQGWWEIRLLDGSTGWVLQEEALLRDDFDSLRDDPKRYRARVVETARLFLGDPYYWGGRSAYDPALSGPPNTGVDCSGLVGLAYQANESAIPRDAHEQWMNSRKIQREELQPGDLVFLSAPNKPEQITHVMLYIGEGKVIEGAGTGGTVREADLQSRIQENQQRSVAYGRYLP